MEQIQRVTSASRYVQVWTLAVALMVCAAACDDEGGVPIDATLVADVAQVADAAPDVGPVPDGKPVLVDAPLGADLLPPMLDTGPVLDVTALPDGSVMPPGGTAAQFAAYCAKHLACTPMPHPMMPTVNACLRHTYGSNGLQVPNVGCLSTGTAGCTDVATCTGMSFGSGTCTTYASTCTGDINTMCNPGPPSYTVIVDCKKAYGATCTTHSSLPGSFAGCSTGKTCSGSFTSKCSGTFFVMCVAGVEMILGSCAQAGLVCRAGATNCAGTGGPCVGTKSTCASPNTISYCINGYSLSVNCAALGIGFSCMPSTVTGARCQQDTQCDPDKASGTETCTGSMLNVCNGGKKEQVDCKALGFSGCASGNCTP